MSEGVEIKIFHVNFSPRNGEDASCHLVTYCSNLPLDYQFTVCLGEEKVKALYESKIFAFTRSIDCLLVRS